jgi:hypothetical protein
MVWVVYIVKIACITYIIQICNMLVTGMHIYGRAKYVIIIKQISMRIKRQEMWCSDYMIGLPIQ